MQPADRPTPHSPHAAPGDSGHHPLREAWVIIGRGGRRLMWVGIAGAALLIVLGAVFALTPSWVGSLVAAQVGRTVGGDATLDRFAWQGWGKARLEGLVVRVPGWEGAGRDLVKVEDMEVDLAPWTLLWGPLHIHSLHIGKLDIQVVERATAEGGYNFQSLRRSLTSPGDGGALRMDRGSIDEMRVTVGRLRGGVLRDPFEFAASASLEPDPSDPTRSRLSLQELGGAMRVSGWWEQSSLAFDLSAAGLTITERMAFMMPRQVGSVVLASGASGDVVSATLASSSSEPLHGTLEVRNLTAKLPVNLFGSWVRYEGMNIFDAKGKPEVFIRSGKLEIMGGRVALTDLDFDVLSDSADGKAAPLPFFASLEVDLSAVPWDDFDWERRAEWLERVREFAPFDVNIRIPALELGTQRGTSAIEAPRPVADFLKSFMVRELRATAEWSAHRGAPTTAADGTLTAAKSEHQALLNILDGRGSFEEFPYPLTQVKSTIRIQGRDAHVESLEGIGSDGAVIRIGGDIHGMGLDPGVNLKITSDRAPIDGALIRSFPENERRLFESIFWNGGFLSLQRAGLLRDRTQVDACRDELAQVERALASLSSSANADPAQIAALSARAGELTRIVQDGPFKPGGLIRFDLSVTQTQGSPELAAVRGRIDLLEADLLPEEFPYPVRARDGTILLTDTSIEFGDKVPFTTFAGGTGHFSGGVRFKNAADGTLRFEPEIRFELPNERINPRMFAAIPPEPDEFVVGWPGLSLASGGSIVQQINPAGRLTLSGALRGEADDSGAGQLKLDCTIELAQGSIHPITPPGELLSSDEIAWPVGFSLEDCAGSFHVTDESIEIKSFTGSRQDGRIRAQGIIGMGHVPTAVEVRLRNIELAEYAVNLLPFREQSEADALWKRYAPRGLFDADLRLDGNLEGDLHASVTIEPHQLLMRLQDAEVFAAFNSGTITVAGNHLTFNGVDMTAGPSSGFPTRICIEGSVGTDLSSIDLEAHVNDGHLQGPLLHEVADRIDAEGFGVVLRQLAPQGRYDAFVSVAGTKDVTFDDFTLDLRLSDLSVGRAGFETALRLQEPVRVTASDGSLLLHPFSAAIIGGSIEGAGWVDGGPLGNVTQGEFSALVASQAPIQGLYGVIPEQLAQMLSQNGFAVADLLRADASVSILQEGEQLVADIGVDLRVWNASLDVGPGIAEADASAFLSSRTGNSTKPLFEAIISDTALQVANRPVHDVSMHLRVARGSDVLELLDCEGRLGSGSLSATAQFGLAHPYSVAADFAVSGAPIGLLVGFQPSGTEDPAAAAADPGRVDARVTVQGDRDGVIGRRGRGAAAIERTELARMPIALALLQLGQASINLDPVIERGDFEFTIDRSTVNFERFDLASRSMVLRGTGSLDTETRAIALRLANKGTIPLVSDLLGGVSNQIFQIDVRGTIDKPEGSLVPLPLLLPVPELPQTSAPPAPIARGDP
ncbi:MAG: hypothetical protein EBR10_02060 [Planctomycetes bacterium]|nr:hypothetical protein [Planctomycetota bacterium]